MYNISTKTCIQTIKKMSLPNVQTPKPANDEEKDKDSPKDSKPKSFRMFHDDTMRSFFRRLTFSPDGELLIIPAGLVETDLVTNATFIFSRTCFSK